MAWSVGVDVGGTFTDFYARNRRTGEVRLAKRPSTRDNPAQALLEGLQELAAGPPGSERPALDLSAIFRLAHGTTVATNALIQRRGGTVALLTTRGFRDLLEIGRQIRPHMYDLHRDYPPPVVPRQRRFEVAERITAGGRVLEPLSEGAIERAIAEVGASGAEAVAVCFLFAFANPLHEQRIGAALRVKSPGLMVSLSSEVQPEFREYERFSTTALNAYLQPVMDAYVARLEGGLGELLPRARVGINQSNGGLMSLPRTRAFPVRTALSGPAGGVVGALECARLASRPSIITLDMGGTSADVSLARALRADVALEREVAGFPLRLPSVDVHTVGAGGGSIAWFDRDGLLKVGPQSAGASPGPACYGAGGREPTVTDANLLLGRLSERGLLDGRMALDPLASREAFAPIAARLGYPPERVAHGALGIVVANMVRAIRTISVERGYDPRDFTLVAFGGAGPLHARDVAASLGIGEILVPPAPGIVCAQGLVIADLKEDFVAGERLPMVAESDAAFAAVLESLRARADAWFEAEAVTEAARELELFADTRYVGQNFELRVTVHERAPWRDRGPFSLADLRARFLEEHETAYGYCNPDDPAEIVNVRLTAFGRADPGTAAAPARPDGPPERGSVRRAVWFAPDAPLETPVYPRRALRPGDGLAGPAVIEQLDATTLLYPGDRLSVDAASSLLITLGAACRGDR